MSETHPSISPNPLSRLAPSVGLIKARMAVSSIPAALTYYKAISDMRDV